MQDQGQNHIEFSHNCLWNALDNMSILIYYIQTRNSFTVLL